MRPVFGSTCFFPSLRAWAIAPWFSVVLAVLIVGACTPKKKGGVVAVDDNTDQLTDEDATDADATDSDGAVDADAHDSVDAKDSVDAEVAVDIQEVDDSQDVTDQDSATDEDLAEVDDAATDDADDTAVADIDDGEIEQDSVDVAVDTGPDSGPDTGPVSNVVCTVDADCSQPIPVCYFGWQCVFIAGKTQCVALASPEGASCNDANNCTTGDHCVHDQSGAVTAGKCVGNPLNCSDGQSCTTDTCDPVNGCKHDAKPMEGLPCDDGDSCTAGETCAGGKCDNSKVAKKCACAQDADCIPYDDGNPCNGSISCDKNAGYCVNGAPYDCSTAAVTVPPGVTADPQCYVAKCLNINGVAKCSAKFTVKGSACNDKSACTSGDICQDGGCSGKPTNCDDKNPCTDDSCDKNYGCKNLPNAVLCDDGDKCTVGDACSKGVCSGSGTLNGVAVCTCTVDADCASLDVGNLCQGKHICSGKMCTLQAGSAVKCPPSAVACADNVCDPSSGQCKPVAKDASTPCSDGSVCTVGDHCDNTGKCATYDGGSNGVTELVCDDGDPCTTDSCDQYLGCVHSLNAQPCDDGQVCTGTKESPDHCQSGTCQPGANACQCNSDTDCAGLGKVDKCLVKSTCVKDSNGTSQCLQLQVDVKDCSSVNPCVLGVCNPMTGNCDQFKLAGPSCSDDNLCTVGDHCDSGFCIGALNDCDDGNACSIDSCDKVLGCLHNPATDGSACSDGNLCTGPDACSSGACVGPTVNCDDKNSCTTELACSPKVGCQHVPLAVGTSCDDGDACTGNPFINDGTVVQDHCGEAHTCVGGTPKNCDQGSACQSAACSPTSPDSVKVGKYLGCIYPPNSNPCNDGNPCTQGETCAGGTCKLPLDATPVDCDDSNPCTTDLCVSANPPAGQVVGCNHLNNVDACDDFNICTAKDTCGAGKCLGVAVNCDDQNTCTSEVCDPASQNVNPDGTANGCTYTKVVANDPCGGFAQCSDEAIPKCVFPPGQHLMISEIYTGILTDPADDFVEIYNPTELSVDLGDYSLQARAVESSDVSAWLTLAKMPKGLKIGAHGYLLVGNTGTAPGGQLYDVAAVTMNLAADSKAPRTDWQLRIFDTAHLLAHDFVCWSAALKTCNQGTDAAPSPVNTLTPWWLAPGTTANSLERKASVTSTQNTLYMHGQEWLAGNGYDTDDNTQDFVIRLAPEPQNAKKGYEPACSGTCQLGKICNYTAGNETCINDGFCAIGCGADKSCDGLGDCVPYKACVLSEVFPGEDYGQFIELFGANVLPTDLTGYILQIKTEGSTAPADPWVNVLQFPAGMSLSPGRYVTIGSQVFAQQNGMLDYVVVDLPIKPAQGSARLWDPRTDAEIDLLGWGGSGTASSSKPAPGIPILGVGLERKASVSSTLVTLGEGGSEHYAGNKFDTDIDDADWVINNGHGPQSSASGQYEPACKGTCPAGFLCNFTAGAEKCVDTVCGGQCLPGQGCNIKTGACDLYLEIAEFATEGPASTDQTGKALAAADNEYIVLYNPTPSAISLAGMALRYFNGSTYVYLTDKACAPTSSDVSPPPDPNTGWCPPPKFGVPNHMLAGYVEPYSYYLVASYKYDKNLPKPDFVGSLNIGNWLMDATTGAIALQRLNGNYANNSPTADKVAYGTVNPIQSEGGCDTMAQEPSGASLPPGKGVGITGATRRKSDANATQAQLQDPLQAAYYFGAGLDTASNCKDFTAIQTATPASQLCVRAPKGTPGVCGTSTVHAKP